MDLGVRPTNADMDISNDAAILISSLDCALIMGLQHLGEYASMCHHLFELVIIPLLSFDACSYYTSAS